MTLWTAEESEELAPTLERGEVEAELRAPIKGAAEVVEAPAEMAALERREYPVSGQFILTDCFGQEHASLNGEFELIFKRDGERQTLAVPVDRGAFSFAVPDPSDFFVYEMKLADREVSLELEKELSGSHDDQRLLLTARDQCEVRLDVLDAVTRRHLTGVEIWGDGELDSSAKALPDIGGHELISGAGSSPVTLPEVDLDWGTVRSYWVRSEGYAWARVNVDHTRTGDQVVLLKRGGALSVRVEGLEGAMQGGVQTYLHLERFSDGELLAHAPLESSLRHKWESVPSGPYRVSVNLGAFWRESLSLGSAEVTLTASEDASLVIKVDPPNIPLGPVAVHGVVRAHEHWRQKGFSLAFYGIGETELWEGDVDSIAFKELKPDPTDPDLLRWSSELPREGTWQVAVRNLGVHTDFSASLAYTPLVELSIPEPSSLSIHVRDAETGAALPSIGLWYEYSERTQHEGLVWPRAEYNPESERHHLAIPAGRVSMRIYCEGYVGVNEELDLTPGPKELQYEFAPCGRVDVEFMEGSTTVPVSLLDVEVEATPEAGSGDIMEIWVQSLVFNKPGAYQVKFVGVPGFLDAVTTITAPERGVAKHTIHLVRE